MGEVYGDSDNKSDNNNDDSSDGGSDNGSDSNDAEELPEEYKSFDTTWIKDKVANWHGLGDAEFKQQWQDTVANTWASKFKWERPEWAK